MSESLPPKPPKSLLRKVGRAIADYAMIRDGMIKRDIPEIGVNPQAPDFVKLAEAFGCPGVRVSSLPGLQQAMANAMHHAGPSLIVVHQDDSWLLK